MHNRIFFTNVLRLLNEFGMTKSELANRSGVSISFLSELTTGKANPSLRIMQAIAEALETPLPILLESTDLDRDTLNVLADGKASRSLPNGLSRVSTILTDYQAFEARKWDQENRKRLGLQAKRRLAPT